MYTEDLVAQWAGEQSGCVANKKPCVAKVGGGGGGGVAKLDALVLEMASTLWYTG